MFEKLLRILTDKNESIKEAPEGVCPNCWGNQEYGKMIREVYKDKQIDVNNHAANQSFIQEFVTTNLNGIKLKKTEHGFQCAQCHTKVPS